MVIELFNAFNVLAVSACASSPCLNDATCAGDGIYTFRCDCPAWFTGSQCEGSGTVSLCSPDVSLKVVALCHFVHRISVWRSRYCITSCHCNINSINALCLHKITLLPQWKWTHAIRVHVVSTERVFGTVQATGARVTCPTQASSVKVGRFSDLTYYCRDILHTLAMHCVSGQKKYSASQLVTCFSWDSISEWRLASTTHDRLSNSEKSAVSYM